MSIDTAAMNFINQHNQMKIARTNAGLNKYGIDTRAQLQQQNLDLRKRLFDLVQLPESQDRLATSALNREIAQYGFDADRKAFDIAVDFDDYFKAISIEEKPENPQSNHAIVGVYIFDDTVIDKIETLEPSARGEYEITDLISLYIEESKCVNIQIDGWWIDAGTPERIEELESKFSGMLNALETCHSLLL